MRYIHAIKGSVIALIGFCIAVFVIPGKGPSDEVTLVLTVSTFLFAILAGFFISRQSNRYDKLRDLIASEDGSWLSLYNTTKACFSTDFTNKIRELIDKYLRVTYDFNLGEYYKHNAKHITAIYDELKKSKLDEKNIKEVNVFDDLITFLATIEDKRNSGAVLASERLSKGKWTVLIILAAIITFSVFYLKTDELYSQIITILLSTVLVLVILIIRDLQNLKLGGNMIATESGQEVIETLGMPRYYHQKFIQEGTNKVPKRIKKYRLGTHKPGDEPKIKIITR